MRGNADRRLAVLEARLGEGSEAQLKAQRAWEAARWKANGGRSLALRGAYARGEIGYNEYKSKRKELDRELDEQFPRPFPEVRDPRLEGAAEVGRRLFGQAQAEKKRRTWEAAEPVEEDESAQPVPEPREPDRRHPWVIT